MELRCPEGVLFGVLDDPVDGRLTVLCRHWRCGKRPGVVVRHRFDLTSGKVETKLFAAPPTPRGSSRGTS